MQIITIAGNVTKDAVQRRTQNGEPVLGFSVAVNGRDDKSTFFDCSMWGRRAEAIAPHITKGAKVAVSGEFGTREHEGRTYLTVNVQNVTLQGGKREAQQGSSYDDNPPARQSKPTNGYAAQSGLDDDIPFAPQWK